MLIVVDDIIFEWTLNVKLTYIIKICKYFISSKFQIPRLIHFCLFFYNFRSNQRRIEMFLNYQF